MILLAFSTAVFAQPTDLIISEYVEGSFGTNKYLELYNGTGAAIDLSNYELRLYTNGQTTYASATLSGSLASGNVIVYKNSASTLYAGPAVILNAICNFNGDDAVALYKIPTASFVDIFGNIGCDPGTAWNSGGLSTADRALVRNANICAGVTVDPATVCPFPTLASEWTSMGMDNVSNLGAHTMTCGPTVNFSNTTGSAPEMAGSVSVDLSISPATTVPGTITITVANGAGTTYGGDYTTNPAVAANTITINVPAGATTASFMINIVDDIMTEANETITFTLSGATGGMALGSTLTHTFTIVDNDVTPTVNFSTLSIAVLENAGVQNFQLSINPAAPAAGSITIQVTDGPGAQYGLTNDYLTNPAVVGGVITVPFNAGATTATFSVTVLNDTQIEDTETVTFTILAVPTGFTIGGNNTATLTIGDNDTPPTVLEAGDLVIVGVNANTFGCVGAAGDDEISFFSFKPIVPGTSIIITDNGYERCNAGLWGNSEGTVRMTRTGIAIPAGQVITFRFNTGFGPGNVSGAAPDNAWTCTSLNGSTSVNMNSGGDQIFFMQGGTWNTGTTNGHNASYNATILFAFSTNPTFPWSASCNASPNQRSNLPPGIQCFSMAPTLATDFNKYVGPITAASQRNWIIRLENVANWATYANCSDYASQGYNWLTAPIMPITAATFEPGKWTGAISTDWFDCKNWDDAQVPTILTDVLIDESALQSCVVGLAAGLSPAGTGECASLTMTNAGDSRHLTLDANSTLNVDGPVLVERTAGTGALNLNLQAGATINATDILLQSVNAGEARLNCNTATSLASLEGNLTMGAGGFVSLGAGGTIQLGGNWSNFAGEAQFVENAGRVRFNGPNDQYIMTSGFEEVFFNLDVMKTGGGLQLSSPVAVRGTLQLDFGLVHSSAAELLSMRAGSVAAGYSDVSFVHGPLQKIGITPFTFPVGKNNSMRPCGLRNHVGTASDAFIAEYFAASPITTFNDVKEPSLDHISDCEYWTIDRSIGNANAVVELTWDTPESCGVTDLPSLRVARFDGTMWRDRGNGGATGTTANGTIPTAIVQNQFSPWTLASNNYTNPLPITLVSFTGKAEGDVVRLEWVTASEQNNSHFTVERSRDGIAFEDILMVPGAGNSQSMLYYHDLDRSPYDGINYYRLRQTDHDGTTETSGMISVVFSGGERPLVVYGTADVITALHRMDADSQYEIMDMTGRLVLQGRSGMDGRADVSAGGLPRGAYLFRITGNGRTESVRFVY